MTENTMEKTLLEELILQVESGDGFLPFQIIFYSNRCRKTSD